MPKVWIMPNYLNHRFLFLFFFYSCLTNMYSGITIIAKFKTTLMLHHIHKTKATPEHHVVNFIYSKYYVI